MNNYPKRKYDIFTPRQIEEILSWHFLAARHLMNTLNGFWNYVQSLDVKVSAEILGDKSKFLGA